MKVEDSLRIGSNMKMLKRLDILMLLIRSSTIYISLWMNKAKVNVYLTAAYYHFHISHSYTFPDPYA